MNIAELASTYGTSATTSSSSSTDSNKEIGQQDFLTLLVEQIKNQDPLNPMQSMEFTSQLTQFSSLEQLFGVNKALSGIQDTLGNQRTDNGMDYIGKNVLAEGNTIGVNDGYIDTSAYKLDGDADVSVYIYDQWGAQVRRLDAGHQTAGEYTFTWDGLDNRGKEVADGNYTFEISAQNDSGTDVTSTSYLNGVVSEVGYNDGQTYLTVGNQQITPEMVDKVRYTSGGDNTNT